MIFHYIHKLLYPQSSREKLPFAAGGGSYNDQHAETKKLKWQALNVTSVSHAQDGSEIDRDSPTSSQPIKYFFSSLSHKCLGDFLGFFLCFKMYHINYKSCLTSPFT